MKIRQGAFRVASFPSQRGFSLFEVLVTVTVISIGLLGLAGLQFAALRASNNAQEYTMANLLAQDIEERIRAGDNPIIQTCPPPSSEISSGISDAAGNCIPILPSANASVIPDPATDPTSDIYTVTISWNDTSGPQALTAKFGRDE
jgi:type IV pilus assembly protein PilV